MLVLGLALIGGGIGVLACIWQDLRSLRPWLRAAVPGRGRAARAEAGRGDRHGATSRLPHPPTLRPERRTTGRAVGRAAGPLGGRVAGGASGRAVGRATVPHPPPPQSAPPGGAEPAPDPGAAESDE